MNLSKLTQIISNITQHEVEQLNQHVSNASQVLIIGNGGSNAIASHIAIDYQKFLNKKVTTITDSGLLSMLVNDYGSDNAYSKFIEMNYQPNTLVILISSSGKSQNIIHAMMKSSELGCSIITLSGFDENCPLNNLNVTGTVMKYHVNDNSYGVVENAHQIFLHSIIKA